MPIHRKNNRGFTLTEIMVVIAVIALLMGMALPNFLRMRANASKAAAIKALRTLNTAFEEFWQSQTPHRYPANLAELDAIPGIASMEELGPAYVDTRLTSGAEYQGYIFTIVNSNANTYTIQATPVNPTVSGNTIYIISESGTISVVSSGN